MRIAEFGLRNEDKKPVGSSESAIRNPQSAPSRFTDRLRRRSSRAGPARADDDGVGESQESPDAVDIDGQWVYIVRRLFAVTAKGVTDLLIIFSCGGGGIRLQ
jgi:hypothetical protein